MDQLHEIYSYELEIKETSESERIASYMEYTSIGSFRHEWSLVHSLFDSDDHDVNFNITNFTSRVKQHFVTPPPPIYDSFVTQRMRYARAWSKRFYHKDEQLPI